MLKTSKLLPKWLDLFIFVLFIYFLICTEYRQGVLPLTHSDMGLNLVTAYRHLETYALDTGAGILLIHLQPPLSVMHEDLRCGRVKMTR